MSAQLRQYQLDIAGQACNILNNYGIVLLTLQVRTGKTLTSFEICRKQGYQKVLFVTKKAVIDKIKDEFHRFGYTFELIVINYEQLKNFDGPYDCIVVDEHHAIGAYAPPSLRAQELKRICGGSPVILLSGSPTPESWGQLYHALWISERSPWREYKNFYAWFKVYGIPKIKYVYNRQINDYDHCHVDKVQESIRHLQITYTQEEAGFSTKVEHHILNIKAPEVIKWTVKKLVKDKVIITQAGLTILADTAVKEQNKVHQIWSGTIKTEEGERILISDYKAKFIAERFKGQKIAIFYKYIAEGDVLRAEFKGRIADTPQQFNLTDGLVYISQIVSGREGIDLSTADCLVMYNVDFSALSYLQAPDRINTKDRNRPARIYWIVATGGIEEKILRVVQGKQDFTVKHYKRL